jgi:RNA polymerase sigma-70 factor (ECF subfamily)
MVERVDGNDFTPTILTDPQASPEEQTLQESMMEFVRKMIAEELTERQRTALVATMIQGVPMEEVAERMGTNRNALYKLIYDARQRLQRSMQEHGISPQDVLAVFD